MNTRLGYIAMIAAAALSGVAAAPVQAADPNQPVIVTGHNDDLIVRRVSYSDLNLIAASDQKTLTRRVGKAVGQVCNEATGPNPLYWAEKECASKAWSGARPQIAQAIERARQMAMYGHSTIALAAIRIDIGR